MSSIDAEIKSIRILIVPFFFRDAYALFGYVITGTFT